MVSESLAALFLTDEEIRLDIGCGHDPTAGFIGMDIRHLPQVEIVHDVNIYPWPIPDGRISFAVCNHLIEHIPPVVIGSNGTWFPFLSFMDEAWRIMRFGGEFGISYPHGASDGFMRDPTHCHPMNEHVWSYFDPLQKSIDRILYGVYRPKPWRIKLTNVSSSMNITVVLEKIPETRV